MRLFIASGFSAPVLDRIIDVQNSAKPLFGKKVKWVEPGNIHLTYAFLGETNAAKLPAIQKSVDEAAVAFGKIPVTLGGFGIFPSPERPRVLWLGIRKGADALAGLALKLHEGLAAEGFILEHEFSAHITIARVRSLPDRGAMDSVAKKAEGLTIGDVVTSLDLMESRLTASGPEYRILYSKQLL